VVALEVAGVAETNTICGVCWRNSSKVCGPVVERARQPEAVVDQRLLARAVALVHAADLRDGLVRLVDEADEVVGKKSSRQNGRSPGCAAVQDARVVLDAVAEAELAQHLHVELRALAQPVRLEQLALLLELGAARLHLVADLDHRALDRRAVGGVVRGRPDAGVLELREDLAVSGSKCWIASISSPKKTAR
jgi:hypothetical protein